MNLLIIMWIARDKEGTLSLWSVKPHRSGNVWWSASCPKLCYLPDNELYSAVTWERDPLEVEIVPKGTEIDYLGIGANLSFAEKIWEEIKKRD